MIFDDLFKPAKAPDNDSKFRTLIEHSIDAVTLVDSGYKITYASPSITNILNFTPKEITGNNLFEYVHDNERMYLNQSLTQLKENPNIIISTQFRMKHKDGSWRWLEGLHTNLLSDSNVAAIVINVRDITDRKLAEEALMQSEQSFHSLADAMPQIVWTAGPEGKPDYFNQRWYDYTGLSHDMSLLSADAWKTVIHPDDYHISQERWTQALGSGNSYEIEYRIRRVTDGQYRWHLGRAVAQRGSNNKIIKWLGTCTDIDDQKKIEKELQYRTHDLELTSDLIEEENVKNEAILMSIGEGVVVTDTDQRVTFVNRAFERMVGWKMNDAAGRIVFNTLVLEDEKNKPLETNNHPIYIAFNSGEIMKTHAFFVRKDQTKFFASITSTPIILGENKIGTITVFRDTTKEFEVDKAKNELIAMASHQLRTPPSIINWRTEMLLAGHAGPVNDKQKEYIDEIYKASHRMVKLINSLLNISRLELGTFSVKPEPIDLKTIAQAVLKDLQPQIIEKEQHIEESYNDNVPTVEVDSQLTGIIFQNLLTNAIKYTPAKGTVKVGIVYEEDMTQPEASHILITVEDTGYGIPPEQQNKIFTKMFRGNNVGAFDPEGSGLGLYIVKQILDKTGGKIWFESELNKGTKFYVQFPKEGMKPTEGTKSLV